MARKYSKVGGYPLFYFSPGGRVACGDCADDVVDEMWDVEPNWENKQLHCDECSARIESAYAD